VSYNLGTLIAFKQTNQPHRSNPAVIQKAAQVFQHIVQALEAEMIQGQIATKVAASAKQLVAQTGINAEQILQTLTPEGQAAVKVYFQ
jgi:importin-5